MVGLSVGGIMTNKLISGNGTGWLRDLPDWRDHTLEMARQSGVSVFFCEEHMQSHQH